MERESEKGMNVIEDKGRGGNCKCVRSLDFFLPAGTFYDIIKMIVYRGGDKSKVKIQNQKTTG